MSQSPPPAVEPAADTPRVERPPFDYVSHWAPFLVALGVGLACALLFGAIASAVLLVVAAVAVMRRARRQRRREGVIFMNGPDVPYAGPTYRVRFYDGQYEQLTDLDLSVALPALRGPAADAALDALARECAAEVESRDSQRCFRPRVVVVDGLGNPVRAWQVTA